MELKIAKASLDKIIKKARVHFYKPIQIAEILYRDRVINDINLSILETYRTKSKKWRDLICIPFVGRTSTSSARYQDDLFNESAVPPSALVELGKMNREKKGIVEAYIYTKFNERYGQMYTALNYSKNIGKDKFELSEFLDLFWSEPGLKRSIDKIYEVIVYSLFSVLIEELELQIEVSLDPSKLDVLKDFDQFAKKVIGLNSNKTNFKSVASINRVGITNAADRGLDMWANFGPAIQVKHLSLDEKLAFEIATTITSDSIVIVCKDAEEEVIKSLLNQIGWRSRIKSIVIESELIKWYEKALRGRYSNSIGNNLLTKISDELNAEFPSADNTEFKEFYKERGYAELTEVFS